MFLRLEAFLSKYESGIIVVLTMNLYAKFQQYLFFTYVISMKNTKENFYSEPCFPIEYRRENT